MLSIESILLESQPKPYTVVISCVGAGIPLISQSCGNVYKRQHLVGPICLVYRYASEAEPVKPHDKPLIPFMPLQQLAGAINE